jgi:uncharacterized membrane protein YgcG
MYKCLILCGFFLVAFGISKAQTIKGVVVDKDDKGGVTGATVTLSSVSDSSKIQRLSTNKNGSFVFQNVDSGVYKLIITSVSYQAIQMRLSVRDSVMRLDTIYLARAEKVLERVTIVGTTPPVKQKTDTVEYSANQYKVNPDANGEDLLKKMPGITVDNGTVTAHGEKVQKVTVDGRDFFGDDATAALRNLPSEVIDKIQVFDKLSDQAQFTGFDDGSSVKAINIVTKANMRNGQFGRVYAGYGTDERYSAGGNVSFFKGNQRISFVGLFNNVNQQNFSNQDLLGVTSSQNRGGGGNRGGGQGGNRGGGNRGGGGSGGDAGNFLVGQQSGVSKTNAFGINYSNVFAKKVTVTGSYFFNNSNMPNHQTINRQYVNSNPDSVQLYKEDNTSANDNYNNRVNMRIEYKVDSFNSLIITPNLSFQNNTSSSSVLANNSWPSGQLISKSDYKLNSASNGYNLNNGILFRHAFPKKGRTISLSLNNTYNKKDADNYLSALNTYYKSPTDFSDSTVNQYSTQNNHTNQYNINLAYSEPVGKKGQLLFNYNPTFSKSIADQETFDLDGPSGKYSILDTSLSNKFNSTFDKESGGITYRVGDKDNQFSIGASYQYATLKSDQQFPQMTMIDKSFSNLLPNLTLRRKLSAKSSIRIFYRASTTPPSITQLQNVINNSNQFLYTTGNPDLQQQYAHNVSARYTFTDTKKGKSFFANIFLQAIPDYITNATYIASKDSVLTDDITLFKGSQITKPVNLSCYLSARSFFTFGMPVKFIKSNLNLNTGISYSRLPGLINNIKNISDNYAYNVGAVIASNISEHVDFTVSYSGNFNTVKNTLQPSLNNNYYSHTASAQINLLSKKGWFIQSDVTNQLYSGLSAGFNQNYWLWNGAVGKKFLKNQASELKVSVFDILKQNNSIVRTTTESYIEDVQNDVLRQYLMLAFSYKLKNFGTKKTPAKL